MASLLAVAFDLWETILTNPAGHSHRQDARRIRALADILTREAIPRDHDAVERAYRELWSRCHDLYWSRDLDIPTRRQIEHLLEAMSLDPEHFEESLLSDLERAYAESLLDDPPELVAHARETLRRLHDEERAIGLISNTGRTPGRVLRQVLFELGVGEYFTAMRFSNEEGVCKPVVDIFTALLGDLEAPPHSAVFVGDNADADVYGAKSAGMRAVLFDPPQRGTAFAPPLPRDVQHRPDAVIRSLADLPEILATLERA